MFSVEMFRVTLIRFDVFAASHEKLATSAMIPVMLNLNVWFMSTNILDALPAPVVFRSSTDTLFGARLALSAETNEEKFLVALMYTHLNAVKFALPNVSFAYTLNE